MGSTRKWRLGQMQRARDRDQRLVAGMVGNALEYCFCIGEPRWPEDSTGLTKLALIFPRPSG